MVRCITFIAFAGGMPRDRPAASPARGGTLDLILEVFGAATLIGQAIRFFFADEAAFGANAAADTLVG